MDAAGVEPSFDMLMELSTTGIFHLAAVESQMLELGTAAPAFSLPDPDGEVHTFAEGAAAYLVMFICNHCPFVIHVRDELARLGRDCAERGVAVYAISSNDVDNYPADAPEHMKREAAEHGFTFPYLYDEDQAVAKAYPKKNVEQFLALKKQYDPEGLFASDLSRRLFPQLREQKSH